MEKSITNQIVLSGLVLVAAATIFNQKFILSQNQPQKISGLNIEAKNLPSVYQEVVNQVLPSAGFRTNLIFAQAVKKLVDDGVIDLEKFKQLYAGEIPADVLVILTANSNQPLVINDKTANTYLNFFWALGLANKTSFNEQSPLNGPDLNRFASTGGWSLGQAESGGEYFNRFEIIKLTPRQEQLVLSVARNTFRPCCDNSTFFQDCNHGSALLGALELAASQGLTETQLYRLALQLNSFWFPDNYVKTAVYLKLFENKDWRQVNPPEIMSAKYSSISGWLRNVALNLKNIPELTPAGGGGSCGVQ